MAYTDEILRALADPERLAIAGSLARGPGTVDELAAQLELRPERVRKHLVRLAAVRVVSVDEDRRTHRLRPGVLREAAQDAGPPRDPGLALGAIDGDEEAVLRQYFREGRLREIPAKQFKRLVVLNRIALEFEVGRRYSEPEVNEIVIRFHNDYASLRRYLVDEELLSREHGVYWRSGEPVEV
ncbi:MAG: DUF2087 domain-containing protein [Actinomycetota bacterium]|nr:DUF2087 domain-containing protein [Actinomycetota bacterium]